MALHEDNVTKMHAVGHTDDSLASAPYNPETHPRQDFVSPFATPSRGVEHRYAGTPVSLLQAANCERPFLSKSGTIRAQSPSLAGCGQRG